MKIVLDIDQQTYDAAKRYAELVAEESTVEEFLAEYVNSAYPMFSRFAEFAEQVMNIDEDKRADLAKIYEQYSPEVEQNAVLSLNTINDALKAIVSQKESD